jgi:demethylmenaquinone methyltransferase/2-methoxy-6-polyprenyl-1,4-benzoquinol methylase
MPARVLFRMMAPVMESPLRRRFFEPVKILKAARIQSGQEVLEIGCGTGFYTIPAAELVGDAGHLYAVDIHPLAIEQVARKVQNARLANVKLIKADALATGLASDSMDLVLLLGVIPSPTLPLNRLLPEMHRVLRPGGFLTVWTAIPWRLPESLTKAGLFVYVGKANGVHRLRRERIVPISRVGSAVGRRI